MKRSLALGLTSLTAIFLLGSIGATSAVAAGANLCKESESPCGEANRYSSNTNIEMSLPHGEKLLMEDFWNDKVCQGAKATGTTTNVGGANVAVNVDLSSFSFSECECTITVYELGEFNVEGNIGTPDGNVTWSGFKIEGCKGCVWTGPVTEGITLEGGSEALLVMDKALVGTESGCLMQWTGAFRIDSPKPLYVSSAYTLLCPSKTSPCSGSAYEAGTTLSAQLKTGTQATLAVGIATVNCEEAALSGEVTKAGWLGEPVEGELSAFTFGKCSCTVQGSAFETLSKPARFEVTWLKGNDGKVALERTKVQITCEGKTCFYSINVKEGITLEGGSPALIKMKEVTLQKQPFSNAGCSSPGKMTAEYEVAEPEPLYVSLN